MQIILEGVIGNGQLWVDIVKTICGRTPQDEYSSICDLMSHKSPYTPMLGFSDRTYVDIQDRGMDFEEEKVNFVHMDVFAFFKQKTIKYDVMLCSDGIEHLNIEKGNELIGYMENQSEKQIIFTPLGPYMITEDEHPDAHKSGWFPAMLSDYLSIILPNFHEALNVGAFFSINCSDQEKQRIYNEIKTKYCFYDKN